MNNKTLAVMAIMCAVTSVSHAQWTTVSPNTTTNDNVGIGTTTPAFKLEVAGTTLPQKTIGINGMPLVYLPDQSLSVFYGSVAFGNGLRMMISPSGKANTVVGINAGLSITSGESNTATGFEALRNTTTAFANAAFGIYALRENIGGGHNCAMGGAALQNNISGGQNSAVGSGAIFYNTTGFVNTGSGFQVMFNNTTGGWNTASGGYTLNNNTTGSWNTAIGATANTIGGNLTNATAIGAKALIGKSNAMSLGDTTQPTLVGIGTAYPDYQLDVRAAADPVRLTGLQAGSASDYVVTVNSAGVLRKMPASGSSGVTGANQGLTLDGSTVVLGDYCGKGGGKFEKDREINMVGYNLYFNSSEKGKLYMGAQGCKDLMTRLEIGAKGLDIINDYDTKRASPSGLRFTDLTATDEPIENKYNGVLSLDEDGDVIWVRECCSKGKAANTEDYQELKNTVEELKAQVAELKNALAQVQNKVTDNGQTAKNILFQNIPNPSDGGTTIDYLLAAGYDDAYIAVYSMDGKMMKKIALQTAPGRSSVTIDIAAWATGTYTYSLFAGGRTQDTKKMQIVR